MPKVIRIALVLLVTPFVLGVDGLRPAIELQPVSGDVRTKVQNILDQRLYDGPSTRWDFRFMAFDGDYVCGFLNTKNLYGAYTGWHAFYFHSFTYRSGETSITSHIDTNAGMGLATRLALHQCHWIWFNGYGPLRTRAVWPAPDSYPGAVD